MAGISDLFSGMGMGGSGGGKATASSNSTSSATNSLNLAFNPILGMSTGGMYPYTSGDTSGSPTSSASGTATANPADTNPSMTIPWYYGGGTGTYDVGTYRGTTGTSGYVTGTTSANSQSSMVLFAMIGIALIFLMKK